MTQRTRNDSPRNRRSTGEKNVVDPGEVPLSTRDGGDPTARRHRVCGDAGMRLPFEHDETGDVRERGEPGSPVIEQAKRDVESGQVDTDRRGDATIAFNRGTRDTRRR